MVRVFSRNVRENTRQQRLDLKTLSRKEAQKAQKVSELFCCLCASSESLLPVYSLVDGRCQFHYSAFTENHHHEVVARFQSGDAVVYRFVVFVGRRDASK